MIDPNVLAAAYGQVIEQRSATHAFTVVGISGAQGSGKSTLAAALAERLRGDGLHCAVLSIDDLYFGRAERARLARDVHPLFATRGVPGTHDVALGIGIIARLRRGEPAVLPRFDKVTDDRVPSDRWERLPAGTDMLILEGWCIGAPPQSERDLGRPINALERDEDQDGRWRRAVNDALSAAYRQLFAQVDCLIFLAAPSFDVVEGWRMQQEHALHPQGGGMTRNTLRRFIAHYERLTRHMLAVMPVRADLTIALDAERRLQSRASS